MTDVKATIYQCDVCKRVLDLYQNNDGFALQHTSQDSAADHEPVPVPLNETVIARCDFCNLDEVAYQVPARDFHVGATHDGRDFGSMDDWAACNVCGLLIDSNRWTALAERAAEAYDARHPDKAPSNRTVYSRMYRKLRQNMNGPIRELPKVN